MTQNADGQVLIRAELDTSAVNAGITEMKTALEAMKTYAARQLAAIRVQAQTEGNTLSTWVPGLASRLVGALATGLGGGGLRVGNALRTTLGTALNSGNEYAPRFSSIGTYVISGIINGIQGSASALWNTLRAVAANMLNTLKNALGIQSPSRLMREEVGRQIGAGIAQGMLDSRDLVSSAAMTLAEDAVVRPGKLSASAVSAAGVMLRSAAVPGTVRTGGIAGKDTPSVSRGAPSVSGNTFIFQKPVETPYRHAQAIRETMEEMLYGT